MASFKKLPSGWQYRVSYKEGSQYKTKSGNGFTTKKEAKMAADKIEAQFHKGFSVNTGEQIFSEYFREWFELYRKGKNSLDNDRDIDRAVRFAEKTLVDIKIKDLTREKYQQILNDYGETKSTASVSKRHIYMKACIQDLIQDGAIYKDPTYKITVKGKIKQKDDTLKYLNYNETSMLIKELNIGLQPTYISRHIILFGIATGCRFSEIVGMTWDCIDFKNKAVTINKSWDYKDFNDFSATKNYSSNRTITIDDNTLKILKYLKLKQSEFFLNKPFNNDKNLVFIDQHLKIISNNAVNKTLKKYCKKINANEITCHGLRHTHASILLYEGVNIKYVSRRLGHSDIVTTLGTYQHVIDEMEQKESLTVNITMDKMYAR